MIRSVSLLGFALALPIPALATEAADETQPDRDYLPADIVVTGERETYRVDDGASGTKTPTPLVDVPQTITAITEDQLEDQSIRQLGEALRYVPGVSIETGEGHRDEVFIRGQETTADFYLDGLRDDAQYYRPLYNIARVEVLKGANALIFGRGGGGGVVNRVSKVADPLDTFASASVSADSFGALALLTDLNQPFGEALALRLNATFETFENDRDFYEGRFLGVAPTLTGVLGPDTRAVLSYSYDDDERVVDRGVPSLGGEPLRRFDETFFGDPRFNDSSAEVHLARGRIEHRFSDALSANASLLYGDYDKVYANILPRGTDGETVEFSGYRDFTLRENLTAQVNLVLAAPIVGIENTLLAGVEYAMQDTQNGRSNARFATADGFASRFTVPLTRQVPLALPAISLTEPVRDRDSALEVFSVYVQDQLRLTDSILVTAGLRFDRFDLDTVNTLTGAIGSRVDEELSPRGAITFKPFEALSIYASYAESFLPQAGDQFLLISPGEAAFAPERFENYELGLKWLVAPELFLTAAAFRLDRDNTRAPDPDNSGFEVLTGGSRTEGFEIALVGEVTPFWQLNAGYTYLDGEITSDSEFGAAGQRLQQLPEHQVTAWNRFDLTDRFGLGLGAIYQDEQFASFSNEVVLPDYLRIDAAAYFTLSDRLTLQANVENLFDAEYFPSAHGDDNIQPGEPFQVRLGLRMGL